MFNQFSRCRLDGTYESWFIQYKSIIHYSTYSLVSGAVPIHETNKKCAKESVGIEIHLCQAFEYGRFRLLNEVEIENSIFHFVNQI